MGGIQDSLNAAVGLISFGSGERQIMCSASPQEKQLPNVQETSGTDACDVAQVNVVAEAVLAFFLWCDAQKQVQELPSFDKLSGDNLDMLYRVSLLTAGTWKLPIDDVAKALWNQALMNKSWKSH